jgi:hypothetical protein
MAVTSGSGIGATDSTRNPPPLVEVFFTGSIAVSTSEFHSPQSGQRPIHFALSKPHCWQINLVVGLGIIVFLS